MPFKNEHAARQHDPDQFKDLRRVKEELAPEGIDFIYGIREDGSTTIQSVRADASLWTVERFRAWLVEHDLTDENLVEAVEEEEELAKDDASTPAEPSERIKGSDKNEPGSASGKRGGIEVSPSTEKALQAKAQQHNEEVKGDKTK